MISCFGSRKILSWILACHCRGTGLASNRYSRRYFDSRPVEREKLEQILETGGSSPTACNYQPQRIYVMQREDE